MAVPREVDERSDIKGLRAQTPLTAIIETKGILVAVTNKLRGWLRYRGPRTADTYTLLATAETQEHRSAAWLVDVLARLPRSSAKRGLGTLEYEFGMRSGRTNSRPRPDQPIRGRVDVAPTDREET
jgi:hypothetical protein